MRRFALLCVVVCACKAVDWPDPATVSGKVVATDQWGQIESPTAISVTLDNAAPLGQTDDSGSFRVLVPRGIHRITFAKNGYVTTAIQSVDASEPPRIDTAIARRPTHAAWIDSIVETRTGADQLLHVYVTLRAAPVPAGTIPATPPAVVVPPATALNSSAILFIGKNIDVSSRVGLYVGAVQMTNQRQAGGPASTLTQFEFRLRLDELRGQLGNRFVFFAAHANSPSCGCDVDPVNGQRVYSHTGPTSNFTLWEITP
jgi:hypothetical protein